MRGVALIPAGKLGLTLLLLQTLAVQAAEIKVIASTGVASVVTELGRQFEAKTGHEVQTDFAVIAVSKRKIDAGATFDIAILGPAALRRAKAAPSPTSARPKPSSARCWGRSLLVIRRKG